MTSTIPEKSRIQQQFPLSSKYIVALASELCGKRSLRPTINPSTASPQSRGGAAVTWCGQPQSTNTNSNDVGGNCPLGIVLRSLPATVFLVSLCLLVSGSNRFIALPLRLYTIFFLYHKSKKKPNHFSKI